MFLVLGKFDIRAVACAFRLAIFAFKATFNRSSRDLVTLLFGVLFLSIPSSYIMIKEWSSLDLL